MSNSTLERLVETLGHVRETLERLFDALDNDTPFVESMPEGAYWEDGTLYDGDGNELDPDEYDAWDPHEYLTEYPLEIVDERGRNFAVVLTVGGPHIEIEAEGSGRATLNGYWGGEHVTLYGDVFDRTLDWFIDRD